MNKEVFQRTRNAERNIITGIANKVLSILMPFAVRTVMIRCLGMEYLGLDNLFTSILQVLNLSELGLSSAVVYCMYKPVACGDTDAVNAIYAFIRKAYHIIGVIVLVVGFSLVPFLNFFISGTAPVGLNIYVVYCAYVLNSALSFLLFSYKSVLLNANQRLDISHNILSVSRLIMYVCQILALIAVKNYYIYILFLPLSTAINNIITSHYVDKMFPEYKPKGKVPKDVLSDIKHQVAGLCVGKICIMSRNSFDSIVVSTFFGLTLTAIYNNYYYIMNAVVSVMTIFSGAMLPGVGNSIASDTVEKNYDDFRKFNFLFVWASGIAVTCLLCLYQPFMRIWVGNESMLPLSSAILFSVYFFSQMIGNIRATYAEAAGLWWQNRIRCICEAISNIILNVVLGMIFGVNGIIVATILTIVIINFGMSSKVLFDNYFKEVSIKGYLLSTAYYSLITLAACTACYFLTSLIPLSGILGLFLRLVICLIASNMIFVLCYHRLDIFSSSVNWVLNICKKFIGR